MSIDANELANEIADCAEFDHRDDLVLTVAEEIIGGSDPSDATDAVYMWTADILEALGNNGIDSLAIEAAANYGEVTEATIMYVLEQDLMIAAEAAIDNLEPDEDEDEDDDENEED